MISESLLDKNQAIYQELASTSLNNLPFKPITKHEMYLNKKSLHQQIIKKKKASIWKWESKDVQANSDINLKLRTNTMKLDKSIQQAIFECNPSLQISDLGLHCIAQALKRLSSLKNLRLSFRQCPLVTDKGFYELSQGLESLSSLQKLKFWFSGNKMITDQALSRLTLCR